VAPAAAAAIESLHDPAYVQRVRAACESGEKYVDDDECGVCPLSYEVALLAVGGTLAGVDAVMAGTHRGRIVRNAFCAVRPPGHHAERDRCMGFCLFNNVAVTAGLLATAGERVMVLDWDAHHGNGTQEIFYERADVMYVSLHQYPFYPGTGSVSEVGAGLGKGATVNLPMPAGTPGDAYRLAFDEVVHPLAEEFAPSWLLVSAGFDAHRADPLTDLGLTAGDFADLTVLAKQLVAPGRLIAFLEGGYDLASLAASVGACVAALGGAEHRAEPASRGEVIAPVRDMIATAARFHEACSSA